MFIDGLEDYRLHLVISVCGVCATGTTSKYHTVELLQSSSISLECSSIIQYNTVYGGTTSTSNIIPGSTIQSARVYDQVDDQSTGGACPSTVATAATAATTMLRCRLFYCLKGEEQV